MTSNNNNLQISFCPLKLPYRRCAICVLVDVSARVKMEESLQEMAAAARRQASQSKSMFPGHRQPREVARRCTALSATDLLQTKQRCRRGSDRLGQ